jgi:hypothetical protein
MAIDVTRNIEMNGNIPTIGAPSALNSADQAVAGVVEVDRGERASDLRARDADHAREVAQVLMDGEVGVHGRRLRHVGDARSQVGRAGGLREHTDAPAGDLLHAHHGAHQRGLAAATRPEQARHRADGEGGR